MVTHGNHHQAAYTPSYPVDPVWYMDTGATDHLTGELDKLGVKEPYHGKDHVHTANGQGMRISHIGQSTLSTNTATPLCLKDILVCPQVTKNLLSAHKLALDNNVFVEIHPFDLFVKDRDTKEIILSGRSHGALYPVGGRGPPVRQAFTSIRVSSSNWHYRLGHPASPVVEHVLRRHALPIESSTLVCDPVSKEKVISYFLSPPLV
jgi:hypothetical protein